MPAPRRPFPSLVTGLLLAAAGCATPMMPSGGPPDQTPPALVASEPASDQLNVRADRLTLEFSKPLDEVSLQRAFAITPEFETLPRVAVRGRRATVTFPEELRDNTTYVVTLGTDLRDLRGNRLPNPITLAFATGPTLDDGRIEGWVRDPRTGDGVPNINLFAYLLPAEDAPPPDPRTTSPAYRTETGSDGTFSFRYLRDAPFFVVAVQDLNRNRRADPVEPFAAPLAPGVRPVHGEDESAVPVALYVTRVDTLAPEPIRVRPRSDTEVAVRFSEAVVLAETDPAAFAVVDSTTGRNVAVVAVYPDEDPWQVVVETEPMAANRHGLSLERPGAVRDSAGNVATPRALGFLPGPAGERQPARVVAFEPAGADTLLVLRPGEAAAVRFSRPPENPPAPERIRVLGLDGSELPAEIRTREGVRFTVDPAEARAFQLTVRQPDSLFVVEYRPMPADSLGDLTGIVRTVRPEDAVVIEVIATDGYSRQLSLRGDSTYALRDLPAGTYTLRAFADRDGSASWRGGRLAPYLPPEPLIVRSGVRVRARWETAIDPIVLDPTEAPPPRAPAETADPGDADQDPPDGAFP